MAWAGTTTYFDPVVLSYETIQVTTDRYCTKTTAGSTETTHVTPGFIRKTSGSDSIKIPFNRPDGKMIIIGHLIAPDTSVGYVMMAARYPESSDGYAWRSPVDAASSTAENGWKTFFSTNFAAATSQAISFAVGPLESAKWAHHQATSTTWLDYGQGFLEVAFTMTTKTAQTWIVAASSNNNEVIDIAAYELP